VLAAALCVACAACGSSPPQSPAPTPKANSALEIKGDWFAERAEGSGLAFTHINGMTGKFHYAEIIAPGAALFDYDNDGDLDVYLVQGSEFGKPGPGGRLFRNDLHVNPDGTRTLHFTDVTDVSRIVARGYGMGAATGDFDNNGCIDLYLTNLGANQLFRNNCDGTFTDVSKQSRTDPPPLAGQTDASFGEGSPKPRAKAATPWSVSASFFDYDRDGWLDLFVGNYLNWRVESSQPCFSASGRPDYCSPNVYQAQPSRLYHNNRDGTFTDVSNASGILHEFGPALGVSAADFNGDGWIDFYVANDGQPNQLWINQHDGTFRNTGLLSGTALSAHGKAKAGMGVAAGDIDNDGDEDLFVTNLTGEGNDLYINDGSGLFEEQSGRSGLGAPSRGYTGFGTAWFDIDNDGWLDTLIVNGAVQTIEALRRVNDPFPLHQRKLLFLNLRNGRFDDVSARGGAAFALSEVGRGAAFGDIDNDGDIDVLVANNNGKPRLLVNNIGSRNHWIGLRLVGPPEGRDMLGARVGVVLDSGPTLWRRAHSDGSYASASDPRVVVGLGQSTGVPRVRVVWPDGKTEEWTTVAIDRYTTLVEGTGK
jgi:hypothetical protein